MIHLVQDSLRSAERESTYDHLAGKLQGDGELCVRWLHEHYLAMDESHEEVQAGETVTWVSTHMCRSRLTGWVGDKGRYAHPARMALSIATSISGLRSAITPTTFWVVESV